LLDITMPEMSGLEVAKQCAAALPQVKILFLTMHEEDAFFFAALRVGAGGYVLKGASSGELLNAIRIVHAGGVYLTPKRSALATILPANPLRPGFTDPRDAGNRRPDRAGAAKPGDRRASASPLTRSRRIASISTKLGRQPGELAGICARQGCSG
jgi:hypothetical protein